MPDDKKRPYSNIRKVKDHARVYNNICLRFATWVAISSSKERMIIKTKGKKADTRHFTSEVHWSITSTKILDSSSPKLLQHVFKDPNLKAFEVNVHLINAKGWFARHIWHKHDKHKTPAMLELA